MDKKKVKINEYNVLGILLQIVITIIALVFLLLALIVNQKYFLYLEISVIIDLLVMAYNNEKIYKRKKMTVFYIVGSVVMALYVLMTILGVK